MSSCAVSCSTCCRRDSCASATSASSPTATAPHSCRSDSNCLPAQRRQLLRRLHRAPTRFTHSGTVPSAAEPFASSNGSHRPNCWLALHHAHKSVPDEPTPSAANGPHASAGMPGLRPERPLLLLSSSACTLQQRSEAHKLL